MIYLLHSIETFPNRVKIGFSYSSGFGRRKALQLGSPVELEILWEAPGSWEVEQWLHSQFRNYAVRLPSGRIHNEWFDFKGKDPVKIVENRYNKCPYWQGNGAKIYGNKLFRLTNPKLMGQVSLTDINEIEKELGLPETPWE